MNRSEDELAQRLVRHLDTGLEQLDESTRERLRAARERALARYRLASERRLLFAWAGEARAWASERWHDSVQLVTIAALVLGLVGFAYWQSAAPVRALAELDASLLADELPIHAYLDKGFESWLKGSSR
jgi:hypothetical protein